MNNPKRKAISLTQLDKPLKNQITKIIEIKPFIGKIILPVTLTNRKIFFILIKI